MFGFKYIKANPSSYVIQFRKGKVVREGAGLAFWYFAPSTSLVVVPKETMEAPFVFHEVSSDFQEVTVQGQVTLRVVEPKALAALMNFTINAAGDGYISEDPKKVAPRIVNAVQVQVRSLLQAMSLQDLLRRTSEIETAVRNGLRKSESLSALGVGLVDLAILAVKPNPETARALEANVREQILKQADDATYARRNASIEQERAIKENELKTEIAVEEKKRQIRETQLEAERAVLEKRQQIQDQEMSGRIALERKSKDLTTLRAENAQTEADVKAYALGAVMKAVQGVDPHVLQALTLGNADPSAMIALAFQGLAENASRIGELNISPDLLQQLAKATKPKA